MLPRLLRIFVIGLLLNASIPSGEAHAATLNRVDEAPEQVIPLGHQPEQAATPKLQTIVWKWAHRPHVAPALRPLPVASAPRARACSAPRGARVHLRRRRVPRMRDDQDEH